MRVIAAFLILIATTAFAAPSLPIAFQKFDSDGRLSQALEAYSLLTISNNKRGLELAQSLAKANDPYGKFLLGRYVEGNFKWFLTTPSDWTRGRALFTESIEPLKDRAKQGEALAQVFVGYALAIGLTSDKDEAGAAQWYKAAADQGFAPGQDGYGICLQLGVGGPADKAAAIPWFHKAAEQGLLIAESDLGRAYAEGTGVPKDQDKGGYWLREAADGGWFVAQHFLYELHFTKIRRALQKAFSRFPLLSASQSRDGKWEWTEITLNRRPLVVDGMRFSGFRFVCPKEPSQSLLWAFRVPDNLTEWLIIPQKGEMNGFVDWYRSLEPDGKMKFYQTLDADSMVPGNSYLILLHFADDQPIKMPIVFTFIPAKQSREAESDPKRLKEILGAPPAAAPLTSGPER